MRRWRFSVRLSAQALAPVVVEPFEVDRVDGVFLALEPVARNFAEDDLDKSVTPGEWFPHRNFGRRAWAHICPQEPSLLFNGVRLDSDALFEVRVRMRNFLEWLMDARAGLVELPTVVIAANAAVLHPAVRHIRAAMRAMSI